jgi:hypothetical protein
MSKQYNPAKRINSHMKSSIKLPELFGIPIPKNCGTYFPWSSHYEFCYILTSFTHSHHQRGVQLGAQARTHPSSCRVHRKRRNDPIAEMVRRLGTNTSSRWHGLMGSTAGVDDVWAVETSSLRCMNVYDAIDCECSITFLSLGGWCCIYHVYIICIYIYMSQVKYTVEISRNCFNKNWKDLDAEAPQDAQSHKDGQGAVSIANLVRLVASSCPPKRANRPTRDDQNWSKLYIYIL